MKANLLKQVHTFYFEVKKGKRDFHVTLYTNQKGIFGDWVIVALDDKEISPKTEDSIIEYLNENWDDLIRS
jgi:hypothetical protein